MLERLERHKFTPLEWSILEALAACPGAVLSTWDLFDHLYRGREIMPDEKIVTVKINHIRAKLKGTGLAIITIRGSGYQLAEVADAAA